MNRLAKLNLNRPTTQITGPCSIFDALIETETHNRIHNNTSIQTQEETKNDLLEKLMQVDQVEKDFGRIHLLVDRLFVNKSIKSFIQNSNQFHVSLGIILSCTVQMKNSLIKFLDYDDQNVDKIKQSTQPTVVLRQFQA